MNEITFELTNYCNRKCKFCSTNVTNDINLATFITYDFIKSKLKEIGHVDRINLSGGEPLAHPLFFNIFILCEKYADDVPVYSNLIKHRCYNPIASDSVYLEAFLTITPETDSVHLLRRVKQGKELNRPEVRLSRNFRENCSCGHRVFLSTGEEVLTPCNKENQLILEKRLQNKYYVSGAHGVGKSTLIDDFSSIYHILKYENESKNPHMNDIKKRQLWRLLKYKFDDEMISNFENKMIINRCPIDWLVYTETFKKLNWISFKDYKFLMDKYNELFHGDIQYNIIFVNPDMDWSKKRLLERMNIEKKWREEDFEYYNILRNIYNNILDNMKSILNIYEISEVNRKNRMNELKKVIIK